MAQAEVSTTRFDVRLDRVRIRLARAEARHRFSQETPFSPSWDAALTLLEDLERLEWREKHPDQARV